ncbi:hypothetical protein AHAS_Ahas06G0022800 [Arachis hypogaea]
MKEKQPKSVMTDGDLAMKNVVGAVFLGAHHRLCSWHLLRNATAKCTISGRYDRAVRTSMTTGCNDENPPTVAAISKAQSVWDCPIENVCNLVPEPHHFHPPKTYFPPSDCGGGLTPSKSSIHSRRVSMPSLYVFGTTPNGLSSRAQTNVVGNILERNASLTPWKMEVEHVVLKPPLLDKCRDQ